MKLKDVITCLQIIEKHVHENEYLSAEHDLIHIPADAELIPIDSEDGKKLDELGCFICSETGSYAIFT